MFMFYLAQKLSTTLPLRFLEDEGFYVGDRPNVRYSNLSVMESRLLSRPVEVCMYNIHAKTRIVRSLHVYIHMWPGLRDYKACVYIHIFNLYNLCIKSWWNWQCITTKEITIMWPFRHTFIFSWSARSHIGL